MSKFERGPLNDPMSAEQSPRTDRYLIQDITFDRHFDEAWAESRIDDDQVQDMYSKLIFDLIDQAKTVLINDEPVKPETYIPLFKLEHCSGNISYTHENVPEQSLFARSKDGTTFFFKR